MRSPPIKVCDIVQFYSPMSGGVRRYVEEKARYLLENTPHEHSLIIPSHRDAVTRLDRRSIHEIRSPRLVGSASYRILMNRKKILAAVAAEDPDVIETGDPYRAAWIGLEAAERNGIPVVAYYHSDYPRALDRTLRKYAGKRIGSMVSPVIRNYLIRLYNRMSVTVVPSRHCFDALEAIGIQRLLRISLGTNLDVFHPRDSRDRIFCELGLDSGTRLLLYVGRLAREKNIRSLFAMMERLRDTAGIHHLLIVGDGEQRDEVEEKAREVSWLTWLPFTDSRERLADLYSAADLFVHAGNRETFGLVSLEAQACGTRVLAVRGGGLDESLRYERRSVMARDTSGSALAFAVRHIENLDETAADRQGRHLGIARHYSWDSTFERLSALYLSLARPETTVQGTSNSEESAGDSAFVSR
jgi:alpha-1,6-mannosyltransferase